MIVTCPHCRTTYRLDPHKIPAQGVRVRCAICRGAFPVEPARPAAADAERATAASPNPGARPTAATGATPTVSSATVGSSPAAATPGAPAAKPSTTLPGAPAEAGPAPAAPSSSSAPAGRASSPFAADPHARARRLARALISDIVMYHPDRRDRALRAGTLRTEFREEIRKSWEEYVAQVGPEIAQSTPYFREALNDILAQGQKIF